MDCIAITLIMNTVAPQANMSSFQLLQDLLAKSGPLDVKEAAPLWSEVMRADGDSTQLLSLKEIEQRECLPRSVAVELLEIDSSHRAIGSPKQASQDICLVSHETGQERINYALTGCKRTNILADVEWHAMVATGDLMPLAVASTSPLGSSFEVACDITHASASLNMICSYHAQADYEAHVAKVISSLDAELGTQGYISRTDVTVTYENPALDRSITFSNVAGGILDYVLDCAVACNRIVYTGKDFLISPLAMVSMAAGAVVYPQGHVTAKEVEAFSRCSAYEYVVSRLC